MTAHPGLDRQTPAYLAALAANNRKDWFEAHRADYETHWRDAGLRLIEALRPFCRSASPRLEAVPRIGGGLKRIHRDIRFSPDKAPYAPMLHLVLRLSGGAKRHAGFHVVLHADSLGFGAGEYGLEPKALARFRERVADPVQRQRLIRAAKTAEKAGSAWDQPDLKRRPRGFEAEADWEHLLRRKSVILRGQTRPAPDWLFGEGALAGIEALATAHLPLLAWLAEQPVWAAPGLARAHETG